MKSLLLFACILSVIEASSQSREIYPQDSSRIYKARIDKIVLEKLGNDSSSNLPYKMPFAFFQIRDVRFDTSFIGIRIDPYTDFQKVKLSKGTAASIGTFLNSSPSITFAPTDSRLICYIKKFRFNQKDSLNKVTNSTVIFNRVYIEIEGYLESNNKLYPAIRLDTLIFSEVSNPKELSVLVDVLQLFAKRATQIDTNKVYKKTFYTKDSIETRYAKRFNKPILENENLNIGVYKSYKEFFNNEPSIADYQLKDERRALILYTKSRADQWLPTRDVFGFCDGETIWVRVGSKFYPLVRVGNTFEFIVDYNTFNKSNAATLYLVQGDAPLSIGLSGLSILSNRPEKYIVERFIIQVNMENGEFY